MPYRKSQSSCVVIAVGPGKRLKGGSWASCTVRAGETVIVNERAINEQAKIDLVKEYGEGDYFFVREEEIHCVEIEELHGGVLHWERRLPPEQDRGQFTHKNPDSWRLIDGVGNWVFIHTPKCAGRWAAKAIHEAGIGVGVDTRDIGYPRTSPYWEHCAVDSISKKGLQGGIIAGIRNPWEWYASYYQHRVDSKDPILSMYQIVGREPGAIIRSMVDPVRYGVASNPNYELEHAIEGQSLFSWVMQTATGIGPETDGGVSVFVNTTHIKVGLWMAIDELGGAGTEKKKQGEHLLSRHRPSTRDRYPFRHYMDTELIDLIWEKDGWFADRFGFTPNASNPTPIWVLPGKPNV